MATHTRAQDPPPIFVGSAHYVGVALTPELVRYLAEITAKNADPHDRVSQEAYVKFARLASTLQDATP